MHNGRNATGNWLVKMTCWAEVNMSRGVKSGKMQGWVMGRGSHGDQRHLVILLDRVVVVVNINLSMRFLFSVT